MEATETPAEEVHTHRFIVMAADPTWIPSAEKPLPDTITVHQEDVGCEDIGARAEEILQGMPERVDDTYEGIIVHRKHMSIRIFLDVEGNPANPMADAATFVQKANAKEAADGVVTRFRLRDPN